MQLAGLFQRIQLVLLQSHLNLQQWTEAAALFEPALETLHGAPPEVKGELLFQKASCERNLGQHATARKSVTAALPLLPAHGARRAEGFLLLATCILQCEEPEAAGKLVESFLSEFPDQLTEPALILGMQAFLRAKIPERAFALFSNGSTKYPASTERIGIQRLLLEAASASLECGDPKRALSFLAKLNTPEQLISKQKQRLNIQKNPSAAVHLLQSGPAKLKVGPPHETVQLQAELDSLGNGVAFSESARLLTAASYRALNRPHEVALVLEDAVTQLPPSDALEAASLELSKTWFELERWQRLIDNTDLFLKHFPASKHVPLILYLRGCAEQKAGLFQTALDTFHTLSNTIAPNNFSIPATFMHAFTLLLDNKHREAADELSLFWYRHNKDPLAETAAYWLCVAKAQQGPPEPLRNTANAYLKFFPTGENKSAVLLYRAQTMSALNQKAAAIVDLQTILAENPEHACSGETSLLLGDCHLSLGAVEQALAAWRAVPPSQSAAREEGLLKCAKLLYRSERFTELKELLQTFEVPGTEATRIAEVAGWLWKTSAREGLPEEALAWTLERVEARGNDPFSTGIEALLSLAAIRAGSSQEGEAWRTTVDGLAKAASTDGRLTLHSRLVWAKATSLRTQNPAEAAGYFIEAATLYPASLTGAAVLAEGAAALEHAGQPANGATLWRELLKWHPKAPQIDRALCALARLDYTSRQTRSAWLWVQRFEKATPTSPLLPSVLLIKAALQNDAGNSAEALKTLDHLLRDKHASPVTKSETLYRMGEMHRAAGATRVAISYLQRTYVSYSRFQPWAAKAYIACAEAFRALGDKTAARNTYKEFLASDAAADAPERTRAASELRALEVMP